MDLSIFIGLIKNIAILLGLVVLYDYVWLAKADKKNIWFKIFNGFIIGIIGLILMDTPWVMYEGLFFDIRSVMLSISGLFFGAVPTVIAIIMTAAYRIYIGGDGMLMGVMVIITSGIIGIIWPKMFPHFKEKNKALHLLYFGYVVHIVMLICTIFLPYDKIIETLKIIHIPNLTIYPAGTLLLGILLFKREREWNNEKLLADSEERFRNIFENTHSVMLIINPDNGKIVDANPAAIKFYGYNYDKIINELYINDINILPEDQIKKEMEKALSQKKIFFQFKHRLANGEIRDVEVYSGRIKYNDKEYLFSIIHDVSDKIKAEQKLLNLSKIIQESLNEIYIFSADDFKFIDANKGAIKNIGYTAEELQNLTPLDLKPLFTLETFKELISPLNNNELPIIVFETIHRRKDGSEYPVEVHLQKMLYGSMPVFVAFIQDITERKEAERIIRQQEEELKDIFNTSYESIMIDDISTGKIIDCNERTLELYGYDSKEEILKATIGDLSAYNEGYSEERAQNLIKEALEKGHIKFDWLAKRKNGEIFWVEVSLKKSKIGGIERIIAEVRDISERKKYEEELIKAKEKAEESDRLKSSFLANLSHEIRTPMNALLGFAELLKQHNLPEIKRLLFADIILRSGNHLMNIINEIIEISKIETGLIKVNSEPFNINELIKDIYNELKVLIPAEKNLKLEILNDDINDKVIIVSDRVKIKQILTNLISNGIKYTPGGYVSFGYQLFEGNIIFKVKDTGIGIDDKDLELIFRRFYRVDNINTIKEGGIGLGLSIVKSYVEFMGGSISVKSEINKGTEFTINIPLQKSDKNELKEKNNIKIDIIGSNELILVAEDNDYNFLFICELLEQYGYKCIRAANGRDAVKLVIENKNIKLILMDLKMPLMDGFEAFNEIYKINPEIPVIAVTAFALNYEKDYCLKFGFKDYIAKPIDKEELIKIIYKNIHHQ